MVLFSNFKMATWNCEHHRVVSWPWFWQNVWRTSNRMSVFDANNEDTMVEVQN